MSTKAAKVILCGTTTVGKTTLMRALCGKSTKDPVSPTMAAGFSTLVVRSGKEDVQINLWDTAGQEAYRSLIKVYFRGVDVAMILFDLTKRCTFDVLDQWVEEITQNAGNEKFKIILIGNKLDLPTREVTDEEFRLKANKLNAGYIEISALENQNIAELRELIAESFLNSATYSQTKKDTAYDENTPLRPCVAVGKKRYTPIPDDEQEAQPTQAKKCC